MWVFLLPQKGHTANVGRPIESIRTGPVPVGGASPNSFSLVRPSSVMRSVVHGGLNVVSTRASVTPSTCPTALRTSDSMIAMAGHPVKVGSTVTVTVDPSAATRTVTVDSTPPETKIDSGPSGAVVAAIDAARLGQTLQVMGALESLAGRNDIVSCIHLCRGNNRSQWYAEGGYDPIAEKLFNQLNVDAFSLESMSSVPARCAGWFATMPTVRPPSRANPTMMFFA